MFRFLLFFFIFFFSLHLICLLHHVKDTAEVTPRPKERKNQETLKNKKWLHASTVCALAVVLCSTGICRTSHRLVCRACRVAHVVGLLVALHTAERERERKAKGKNKRERQQQRSALFHLLALFFISADYTLHFQLRRGAKKKGARNNICCHSIHFIDQSSVVLTLCCCCCCR
jgi:hypothetical protein